MRHTSITLILSVLMPLLAGCRHAAPTGPAVDTFPVRGIDVSRHNGTIDFRRVADDGFSFVLIKASDGTDHQPLVNLTRNYVEARRAGLKVGLYHYFQFRTPPDLQALNLADAARLRPADFPLVVDVETDDRLNSSTIPTRDVQARLDTLLTHLSRRGHRLMLYTNKDCYHRYIRGRFDTIPLWICSLDSASPADIPWTFWQYSHTGRVEGIDGNVDLDVFVGDSTQFADFTRSAGNKTPRLPLRK